MVAAVCRSSLNDESRKVVRTDGTQSLVDVARRACGDARLAALLSDLNPALPTRGRLAAGARVLCPSQREARAFAARMGILLGLNPSAVGGTDARRRWASHQGPTMKPRPTDAVALSASLLGRGISTAETGRRLAQHCRADELIVLTMSTDPRVRQAALHARAALLAPRAQSACAELAAAFEMTAHPRGLLAVLDAAARSADETRALLKGCAVAEPLVAALMSLAPRASAQVAQAKVIAQAERGEREILLKETPSLKPLVAAFLDGVDALGGDRANAVGVGPELNALAAHFTALAEALRRAAPTLPRSAPEVILAVGADGSCERLPRPWSFLAPVIRAVHKRLKGAPPHARDAGVCGLVGARSASVMPLWQLQSRAATCARGNDDGEAFAKVLAPAVVGLFSLLRPPPAIDGGSDSVRRANRRSAFELAVATKTSASSASGVAALVHEIFELARQRGDASAMRLTTADRKAAEVAASAVAAAPLSILKQPMSELGRALVVSAMALHPDIGRGIGRETAREAFVNAAARHAGRVLSAAWCRL